MAKPVGIRARTAPLVPKEDGDMASSAELLSDPWASSPEKERGLNDDDSDEGKGFVDDKGKGVDDNKGKRDVDDKGACIDDDKGKRVLHVQGQGAIGDKGMASLGGKGNDDVDDKEKRIDAPARLARAAEYGARHRGV